MGVYLTTFHHLKDFVPSSSKRNYSSTVDSERKSPHTFDFMGVSIARGWCIWCIWL